MSGRGKCPACVAGEAMVGQGLAAAFVAGFTYREGMGARGASLFCEEHRLEFAARLSNGVQSVAEGAARRAADRGQPPPHFVALDLKVGAEQCAACLLAEIEGLTVAHVLALGFRDASSLLVKKDPHALAPLCPTCLDIFVRTLENNGVIVDGVTPEHFRRIVESGQPIASTIRHEPPGGPGKSS